MKLEGHQEYGNGSLFVDLRADADHAGDPADAKSISGWGTLVRGEITRVLADWGAKSRAARRSAPPTRR